MKSRSPPLSLPPTFARCWKTRFTLGADLRGITALPRDDPALHGCQNSAGYAAIEGGSISAILFVYVEQGCYRNAVASRFGPGPAVTRENACSPTQRDAANGPPAFIAWRRSCWRTLRKSRGHSCNRVSAAIRACHEFFEMGKHPQPAKARAPVCRRSSKSALVGAEYQSAAALITAAYRGHVDSEINDQYRRSPARCVFEQHVRFPGCGAFDPQSSFSSSSADARRIDLCSLVRPDVATLRRYACSPGTRSAGLARP